MIYTDMTKKAINIMFEAHKNQKDKSNTPYVFHPWSIAEKMTNEIETTTALLHDVAEDSKITIKDLEKEFPKEVIDALKLLTHDENIGYYEYIKQISTNELATKVKLQDLKHNSKLYDNNGEFHNSFGYVLKNSFDKEFLEEVEEEYRNRQSEM